MARSRLSSRLVVLQVHVLVLGCTRAQLEATTRLEQMAMALELQPTSAAAHSNYGIALKSEGRAAEALGWFDKAVSLDPQYGRAYLSMANALQTLNGDATQREGYLRASERSLRVALELMPDSPAAHNSLGNTLRELKQPLHAIAAHEMALQLEPRLGAAYTNLGLAYGAAGQHELAAQWSGLGAALMPDDAEAHNAHGAALQAAGQLPEALEAFERAVERTRGRDEAVRARLNRGGALRASGRLAEATHVYGQLVQLGGATQAQAYTGLGATLQADGRQKLAQEAFLSALAIDPADTAAANNLAKLPVSEAYRAAAAVETRALAERAASAALAAWGAKRAGRNLARLGLGKGGQHEELRSVKLFRLLRLLRRLETEQTEEDALVWGERAKEMPGALGAGAASISLSTFAWGAVWMPSFGSAFAHPLTRAALAKAARGGGSAVVLGSSLGYEAHWLAHSYGVRTVGVELLCSLAHKSEEIARAHGVSRASLSFDCADALRWKLPSDTAVVYADDTAWDPPALEALASKLGRELRRGSIVVHNSERGYAQMGGPFKLLERVEIDTSWHSQHPVYISLRV